MTQAAHVGEPSPNPHTDIGGVLKQHRTRLEDDDAYRESALTPPGGEPSKFLDTDAPTSLSADQAGSGSGDDIDALAGDDLDAAVRDADIEGRSDMTAEQKRQALRDHRANA